MPVLQLGYQLAFIRLSFVAKSLEGIGFGDGVLYYLLFLRAELHHLRLDSGKIGILDNHSLGGHDVVIETVLDGRTDTELDTRIEFLQRLRHEVGRGMPEGMFRLRVVPFMQLDSRIPGNRVVELYDLVIDTCAEDLLRQTRADALCYLQRRDAALILTD